MSSGMGFPAAPLYLAIALISSRALFSMSGIGSTHFSSAFVAICRMRSKASSVVRATITITLFTLCGFAMRLSMLRARGTLINSGTDGVATEKQCFASRWHPRSGINQRFPSVKRLDTGATYARLCRLRHAQVYPTTEASPTLIPCVGQHKPPPVCKPQGNRYLKRSRLPYRKYHNHRERDDNKGCNFPLALGFNKVFYTYPFPRAPSPTIPVKTEDNSNNDISD